MNLLNQLIQRQAKSILSSYQRAVLCAMVLAVTPYTVWLSLSVIGLVTLRRGYRDGAQVLLPVLLVHWALSLMSFHWQSALYNTVLTFLPTYTAAIVLRYSVNWQAVAGVFLLEMLICALFVQLCAPDFVVAQYEYMKSIIHDLHNNTALMQFIQDNESLNQLMVANYLFGFQMVSVAVSAALSLMCSRAIQSKLYYPMGYRQEMLSFRGNKVFSLLFAVVLYAASQKNVLAMDLLPAVVVYFLFAGLSLSFCFLSRKKPVRASLLLLVPLVVVPFVMLPAYMILGLLDSVFNFRVYLLSGRADETI